MDLWHPEQVAYMGKMGNKVGKMYYEATLPGGYGKPTLEEESETVMKWLRVKYEQKKYWGKPTESQKAEVTPEVKPKAANRITRKAFVPKSSQIANTNGTISSGKSTGKTVHSCFSLTDHEAAPTPAVVVPVAEAVIPVAVPQQNAPLTTFAGLHQTPITTVVPQVPVEDEEESSEYEEEEEDEESEEEDESEEQEAPQQPQSLNIRNRRDSFVNLMKLPKPAAVEIPIMPEAPSCNSPTPVQTNQVFPSGPTKTATSEASFLTFDDSKTTSVTTSGGDSFLAELTSSGSPTSGGKCSILDAFNAPAAEQQPQAPVSSGPPPLAGHGVPMFGGNNNMNNTHMDSQSLQSQIQELQRLQKQIDQQIAMSQNASPTANGPPPIQSRIPTIPQQNYQMPPTVRPPVSVSSSHVKDPFSDLGSFS